MQLFVATVVCFVHHEPAAFNVVTRVYHAAVGVPQFGVALRVNAFQRAAQFGVVVVVHNVVAHFARVLVVFLDVSGVNTTHDANDIQEDHGVAQRAAGARGGDGLGAQSRGILHAAPVQAVDHVVGLASAVQIDLLAG